MVACVGIDYSARRMWNALQEVGWCAGELKPFPGNGPVALAGWPDVRAEGGWDRIPSSRVIRELS